MNRYLISRFTALLAIFMLQPALAHTVIHGEVMDGRLTTLSGSTFESLYVETDSGFEAPTIGVTGDDAVLYNIPIDGSSPVPLREVPTLYITDGDTPVVIDESISANEIMRGLVYPGNPNPITFGDWLSIGHSKLKIKILHNGMSKVKMKVKGLLPNSLYGVWQFNQAGGPPGPFAGIPNILATDAKGNATMKRMLPFNINEVVDSLVLVYHSDHRVYGGTPSLLRTQGGPDIHFHLKFDVAGAQN